MIVIPESQRENVAVLLRTSAADLQRLREALSGLEATTSPLRLAVAIEDKVSIPKRELRLIVRTLASWYAVRSDRNISAAEIVSELQHAAEDSGDDRVTRGWSEISEELVKLLSMDMPLGISAKAQLLRMQAERIYINAQILSDARPIFSAGSVVAPAAFVISHTLQISSYESEVQKDFFFVLDSDDVVKLKAVLDRAIQKHAVLLEWFSKSESPPLE
jgi:hypothetical protein